MQNDVANIVIEAIKIFSDEKIDARVSMGDNPSFDRLGLSLFPRRRVKALSRGYALLRMTLRDSV